VRVGACGQGLRPAPGRLRGTALGTLRSLCEELAGRVGGSGHGRHRGVAHPMGVEAAGRHGWPALPYKRGPESEIAEGGAPRGVRRVAQSRRAAAWLNGCGYSSRLAALRQPCLATLANPPRTRAGG
jgi:hypothetical protein